MSTPKADSTTQPPIPLHRAMIDFWRILLEPRGAILRRLYRDSARCRGIEIGEGESLDELRRRIVEDGGAGSILSDFDRESLERRMVLAYRITAAWGVFWMTIFPGGLVATWVVLGALKMRFRGPIDYVVIAGVAGIAAISFLVLSIVGLFLQSLLCRPFMAFVGWFLDLEGSPEPGR